MTKILERAGLSPWKRLFHSMRSRRQKEPEREFPRHVVCAWMGNSAAVAAKSYLLVTEEDYTKAMTAEPTPPKGTETGGTKSGTARRSKGHAN